MSLIHPDHKDSRLDAELWIGAQLAYQRGHSGFVRLAGLIAGGGAGVAELVLDPPEHPVRSVPPSLPVEDVPKGLEDPVRQLEPKPSCPCARPSESRPPHVGVHREPSPIKKLNPAINDFDSVGGHLPHRGVN
jgi:hypothetical protein